MGFQGFGFRGGRWRGGGAGRRVGFGGFGVEGGGLWSVEVAVGWHLEFRGVGFLLYKVVRLRFKVPRTICDMML